MSSPSPVLAVVLFVQTRGMDSVVAAGAGFLLAVLWFDLMFDVQVLRRGAGGAVLALAAARAADARLGRRDARLTTATRRIPVAAGPIDCVELIDGD